MSQIYSIQDHHLRTIACFSIMRTPASLKLQLTVCLHLYMWISSECKKHKASIDLLEREIERLKSPQKLCGLNNIGIDDLNHLRVTEQTQKSVACHVLYLKDHQQDGWAWSSLGQTYSNTGTTKGNSQASTCFKQASSLDGPLSKEIPRWHYLGPFVIGKIEVDGDPLEAYGGVYNVSRFRFQNKKPTYHSELSKDGIVTWQVAESRGSDYIQISPPIAWNDLVNSLGSVGITEWQGWAIGEFAVNSNNVDLLVQCLGVHTVYVDDVPVTGDVYSRDQYKFAVTISKGIHSLYIRLRAKARQLFRCTVDDASEHYKVHAPLYMPQLLDGHLFSQYLYIPISNYLSDKWLRVLKVKVESQPSEVNLDAGLHDKFGVAPGQTRPVIVELTTDRYSVTDTCRDLSIVLKLTTTAGSSLLPVTLTCRTKGQSFVFTFIDHDGSVQHAAAIHPLSDCQHMVCPVLLTLHGTTVPAQSQADSYKRGDANGNFVFGLEKAWVLAPTRHGAHNWEGPGALTALTAVERFAALTRKHAWIRNKATDQLLILAGHSMGGHGAWHLATHFPDRVLALVSLAGWIKKEEYGDSNLFFRHDIANSHVDPSIKVILEACVAENEVDKLVSNLQMTPVYTRVGSSDRTIHPYFVRRMVRLLKEWRVDVTYDELPNKDHWWWDTKDTNDGGCVNDPALREFTNRHADLPTSTLQASQCTVSSEGPPADSANHEERCHSSPNLSNQKYHSASYLRNNVTFTVVNPAFGGTYFGLRVVQQLTPYRTSTIQIIPGDGELGLITKNVRMFSIGHPHRNAIDWDAQDLKIDDTKMAQGSHGKVFTLCYSRGKEGTWSASGDCERLQSVGQRGPADLGPARRIAESPFLIVLGTQGSDHMTRLITALGVYIANLFLLTSDTLAPLVNDRDLDHVTSESYNLILLGNPEQNSLTAHALSEVPLTWRTAEESSTVQLGSCVYHSADTGLLFLAPHSQGRLAMVLMGLSDRGLRDVVSLATPTIPPMTRSPFSNMIGDFMITGPEYKARGPGGYECTGFWGNQWELRSDLISCSHCVAG